MSSSWLIGLGVPLLFAGAYGVYNAEMELPELADLDEPQDQWRDVFTWREFLTSIPRFRRHPLSSALVLAGLLMILVGTLSAAA